MTGLRQSQHLDLGLTQKSALLALSLLQLDMDPLRPSAGNAPIWDQVWKLNPEGNRGEPTLP